MSAKPKSSSISDAKAKCPTPKSVTIVSKSKAVPNAKPKPVFTSEISGSVVPSTSGFISEISETDQRFSRQKSIIGVSVANRSVFISGMNGAGAEIAKNCVLCGFGKVHIHDVEVAKIEDLSSQFLLQEIDVGKNRAVASVPHLKELNEFADVQAFTIVITDDFLIKSKYDVVILVNYSKDKIIHFNNLCRKIQISKFQPSPTDSNHTPQAIPVYTKFISAEMYGIGSCCFIDFGDKFVTCNKNGNAPLVVPIKSIFSSEKRTYVMLQVSADAPMITTPHTQVVFRGIRGMTELNEQVAELQFEVKFGKVSYYVDIDSSKFSAYQSSGYITEIKPEVTFEHQSFETQTAPAPPPFDLDRDMFIDAHLYSAFVALRQHVVTYNGALPGLQNEKDAEALLIITKQIFKDKFPDYTWDESRSNAIRLLARTAQGNCSPVACALGGVAAHAALVGCVQRGSAARQWLLFDHAQIVPMPFPTPADAAPANTRYDGVIAIIGKAAHAVLMDKRIFVAGAGALGCENLKNFVLLGAGCGEKGHLHVTDMDNVELSNLSRQFLFRKTDIDKPKSHSALAAVARINPGIRHAESFTHMLAQATESIFDSEYWENTDMISLSLDNAKARQYLNDRCARVFHIPLIESAIHGTGALTDVIIPGQTCQYKNPDAGAAQSADVETHGCFVKRFPYLITHCVQEAVDRFSYYFDEAVRSSQSYMSNPSEFQRTAIEKVSEFATHDKVDSVLKTLVTERPKNFADCLKWSRVLFESIFTNKFIAMLHHIPLGYKDAGGFFYTGVRRPPEPAVFSVNDHNHYTFVVSAALLKAFVYDLPVDSEYLLVCSSTGSNSRGGGGGSSGSRDCFSPYSVAVSAISREKVQATIAAATLPTFSPGVLSEKEVKDLLNPSAAADANTAATAAAAAAAPTPTSTSASAGAAAAVSAFSSSSSSSSTSSSSSSSSSSFTVEGLVGVFAQVAQGLAAAPLARLNSITFEKDVLGNHHVEFVGSFANIRARISGIEQEKNYEELKRIAGNIIPSISTSASFASGMCANNVLVLSRKETDIDRYVQWQGDLAVQGYNIIYPSKPRAIAGINEWTSFWTFTFPDEFPRVSEFLEVVKKEKGIELTAIYYAYPNKGAMGFCSVYDPSNTSERINEVLERLGQKLAGTDVGLILDWDGSSDDESQQALVRVVKAKAKEDGGEKK